MTRRDQPSRRITPGEAERFLGQPKYEERIAAIPLEGSRSLVVDFFDLYELDVDLAAELLNAPDDILLSLSKAAYKKLQMRDREYANEVGELHVRVSSLPDETSVRDVRSQNITHLIQISGIVVKATAVQPIIVKAAFRCLNCGEIHIVDQADQYLVTPQKCGNCGHRRLSLTTDGTQLNDIQWLTLQERPEELPPGQLPHSARIRLRDDLVASANPGDRVQVTCIVRVLQRNPKSLVLDVYLEANHVKLIGPGLEALEVTPQDEAKIRELAADPWIHRKIILSVAPSLYGLEREKEAVALQLFGGVPKEREDIRIRGDIHALLVGDPSTGKSQLLRTAARIAPRGLFTTGRGTTAAGLTAAVVKESGGGLVLEAGAMVLADMGLCCIDEIEKMRDEDRNAIHPAMEQQIVGIAKGGIIAQLNSRSSILASANPKLGRYNAYQNFTENINLPVTLLNRFDLIFVLRDIPDPERDRAMARHILSLHGDAGGVQPPIDLGLLRKYISYAKHITPRMPTEVRERIEDFFLQMRKASAAAGDAVMITSRQLETLVRLAEARTRSALREEVLPEDAEAAIALMRASLEQVGIDVATGEIDIDVLIGKPKSLQTKLQKVLSIITEMERITGVVKDEELYDALLEDYQMNKVEAAKVIGVLMRDGLIFAPRPGYYKKTSG